MEEMLAAADKEVLLEIVRVAQKQALKGAKGGWKEFLNSHDKMFGDNLSDPARRTPEVLVAFLKTFTEEDYLKFFSKILVRRNDHKAIKQFIKDFPEKESPQQKLVCLTMEHPHYSQYYSFPSFDEDWITVPLGKISKAMKSKRMVSVDCEMVLCQDGTEAVVKVCAVDRKLKVKLDEFVKPDKAVIDYRTEITGVSAEDLEGVTYSLIDAQNALKEMLSHGTILVGHSLHNDLRVLKIDHPRVIDTAYIFKFSDLPATHSPSLYNLCKSVLQTEIRKEGEPHNCLNDAEATMKLVLAKLEHGFNDPIFIRGQGQSSDLAKLLVHKIPRGTSPEELKRLFVSDYDVDIQTDIRVKGQNYSTYAVFKDATEADEAFRGIEGQQNKDTGGRLQKRTLLRLASGKMINIYVRRMTSCALANDNSLSKKRSAEDEVENGTEIPKRQKQCLQQCDHGKEVEKLRQELHQREQEIFNLQLILSALTRKHGL